MVNSVVNAEKRCGHDGVYKKADRINCNWRKCMQNWIETSNWWIFNALCSILYVLGSTFYVLRSVLRVPCSVDSSSTYGIRNTSGPRSKWGLKNIMMGYGRHSHNILNFIRMLKYVPLSSAWNQFSPIDYLLNAENTPRFPTALQVKIQFISIWTATWPDGNLL